MPFQKVEPEKLSTAVVRQIELLILRGVLRPGDRLPAERDLAERLGVSRPSLRDAVAKLQSEGLLTARPGAGVFVAEVLGSAFSPALVRLFSTQEEAVFDYLSFRRDLEGLAAERAARFGSDADLEVISTIFARMTDDTARRTPEEDADLDARFHSAIIEASHNIIMLHMMRSMFDLLRSGVFYNRQIMFSQKTSRAALLDQHRAINDAIQARDPTRARAATEAHLAYVEEAFARHRQMEKNDGIARLRAEQETVRGH